MTVRYKTDNPGNFPAMRNKEFSIDVPSPAIMAAGMYGDSFGHWKLFDDGRVDVPPKPTGKPPFRVPSMAEVNATPPNGLRAISTFAGCGGSSLGYRMAGFKMLWANEFIGAAREVYEANKAEGTITDGRNIRDVDPLAVLKALGLEVGELDLLDGSPPCASFSTAGKREKHWGKVKKYSDGAERTDDLFFEFIRFIRAMKPKVFVGENVSGLIKGVAKGYFIRILNEMKSCGYRVEARLLDAQWLGVPQMRQRIIFVGVREDLDVAPAFPKPLAYRYSVRDALPWLTRVEQGPQGDFRNEGKTLSGPSPTILGTQPLSVMVESETDITGQAIGKEYDRLNPGEASDKYFNLVRADASEPSPTITAAGGQNSGIASAVHPTEKRKFAIAELKRICSFPDDFILTGSYAQQWERLGRAVPPLMMRAIASAIRDEVFGRTTSRSAAPARRSKARSTTGKALKGAEPT